MWFSLPAILLRWYGEFAGEIRAWCGYLAPGGLLAALFRLELKSEAERFLTVLWPKSTAQR